MEELSTTTAIDAIRELQDAAADIRQIDGVPIITLPSHYEVHNLEKLLKSPARARGATTLLTTDSFIAYVSRHKGDDTTLYLNDNATSPSFTAVFNDHSRGDPGWQDFRALYALPLAREWQVWKGADGKKMAQEAFAQFIEDNLPDVVHPSGADMLTISRTLEAKKGVEFKSGIRLADGAQEFAYREDISGTAGNGTIQIPAEFAIGIPVFNGGQAYRVTARLRYRIDGGKLVLWYELLRAHKIIEDALKAVREKIETETGIHAFVGLVAVGGT